LLIAFGLGLAVGSQYSLLPDKYFSTSPKELTPHTSNPNEASAIQSQKPDESYREKVFRPDIFPLWVAAFATLLAGVVALATLSDIQSQTRIGLRTARAAKRSADIATNSERAWVITSGLAFAPDWPDLTDPNAPRKSKMIVEIRNSGRSPAEMKSTCVVAVVYPTSFKFPDAPIYGDSEEIFEITAMPGEIIPAGEKRTMVCRIRHVELLTNEQVAEILKGTQTVYCYGKVVYNDVSGEERTTHFGYYYQVKRSKLDDMPEAMYRLNNRAYNYTT
jgi:hypothetical protein